jgi:hypothetical protein
VPALSLNLGIVENADSKDDEEPFLGWSAIEEAARAGHLGILKRLGPDPARDDFDELNEHARYESIVTFLLTMQPPRDPTRILWWHFRWLEDRFPTTSVGYSGTGVIEAIFKCGLRSFQCVAGKGLSHTQCSRAAKGLLGAGAEWGQGEEATLASAEDEARIDRDIGRGGVIASRLRRFSTRWV